MRAKSRRNISSSSGPRLFWNRKTRQFVAISIQVTTGGYRDGTAFLSGIICAPAAGTGGNRAPGRPGLRRRGGKNVTQHAPQSVQLIDEVENDRDSVVVDPQV